jgi:aryl-alcohol dehydrogenase-like predicted oxidoreductase
MAKKLIASSAISEADVVNQSCIHPAYLEEQLNRSLENLGVDGIDLLYL